MNENTGKFSDTTNLSEPPAPMYINYNSPTNPSNFKDLQSQPPQLKQALVEHYQEDSNVSRYRQEETLAQSKLSLNEPVEPREKSLPDYWATAQAWFILEVILFMLAYLCVSWLRFGQNPFQDIYQLFMGELNEKQRLEAGFARKYAADENYAWIKSVIYAFGPWALVHLFVLWVIILAGEGKALEWLFKVVHLFLPVLMGGLTCYLSENNYLNPVLLVLVLQLVPALLTLPCFLFVPHKCHRLILKLLLLVAIYVNSKIIKYILLFQSENNIPGYWSSAKQELDDDRKESIAVAWVAIPIVISAGWSIIFNHLTRLARQLNLPYTMDPWKVPIKFQGAIAPLVFGLLLGIPGVLFFILVMTILGFLLGFCLCICSRSQTIERNSREIIITEYRDERMEQQGLCAILFVVFAGFLIGWNLILAVFRQEEDGDVYRWPYIFKNCWAECKECFEE